MAPLSTNAVAHFLHPAHRLADLNNDTPYLCDGCKIVGNGARFSCVSCEFDLHVYCAKCPHTLTSTTNHPHAMNLVVYKPIPNQTEPCQICTVPIQGLMYQCKSCSFLVHPLCVSGNSGTNQVRSAAFPSSGSTTQRSVPSSSGSNSHRIGEQVGVGLGTNIIYDAVKDEGNSFFDGFANIVEKLFDISSSK